MLTIMPQYIRKEPNGGTTRGLSQRFQPRGQGVAFQLQGEVVLSWKASKQMVGAIPRHWSLIAWSDNDTG